MYDNCADAFKNAEVILHSFSTFSQLASIDGNTLRAPDGQHDDKADAFALAVCARLASPAGDDEYNLPMLGAAGLRRPHVGRVRIRCELLLTS